MVLYAGACAKQHKIDHSHVPSTSCTTVQHAVCKQITERSEAHAILVRTCRGALRENDGVDLQITKRTAPSTKNDHTVKHSESVNVQVTWQTTHRRWSDTAARAAFALDIEDNSLAEISGACAVLEPRP